MNQSPTPSDGLLVVLLMWATCAGLLVWGAIHFIGETMAYLLRLSFPGH